MFGLAYFSSKLVLTHKILIEASPRINSGFEINWWRISKHDAAELSYSACLEILLQLILKPESILGGWLLVARIDSE